MESLLQRVIALPADAALNVNTASPEVLAAVIPGLPQTDAAALAERARRAPFPNVEAFTQALPAGIDASTVALAVASQYFRVVSYAQAGMAMAVREALVDSEGAQAPLPGGGR